MTFVILNREAQDKTDGSEYHILLILTDGAISDMNETKKVIVQVCRNNLIH